MYMCEVFRSYKELFVTDETLGKELLEEKGSGDWQESDIYFYEDVERFAEHELTEGWYIDSINFDRDFRGAPNPIDYIDLKSLGNALVYSWDNSCYFKTEGGVILSTSYGW